MIICVVGKSGSGKSFFCKLLENISSNIISLDIDLIGHEVLLNPLVVQDLINTFGNSIIDKKIVNRKALSKIVFSSKNDMDKLTEITWKHMENTIDKFINENPNKIILLDWQILPKTKYFNQADLRILIEAPLEIRIKRTLERDNINEEDFYRREKASYDFTGLNFDYIIENDYTKKFEEKAKNVYKKIVNFS